MLNFYTVKWLEGELEVLDQRFLPNEIVYRKLKTIEEVVYAIDNMIVRGAPLIGVVAGYGIALAVYHSKSVKESALNAIEILSRSRKTGYNLFYTINRMKNIIEKYSNNLREKIIEEAHRLKLEDELTCRKIGEHGKNLINYGACILTHCNAGALATTGIGTALAPIYLSKEKIKMVYATETRPWLQGARLTCWELSQNNIPVTLICDSSIGSLFSTKKIDLCIVGADRIAKNGDVANKIGTYTIAVLAKEHNIPFYVSAPISTFDKNINSGNEIPIEYRDEKEIKEINGKKISADVPALNPVFDITPNKYITGYITENGIKEFPFF